MFFESKEPILNITFFDTLAFFVAAVQLHVIGNETLSDVMTLCNVAESNTQYIMVVLILLERLSDTF